LVKLRAVGGHFRGHRGFGEAGRLHAFFDLFGQCAFECAGLHLVVNVFLFQEVIEVAVGMWVTFRYVFIFSGFVIPAK